MTTRLSRLVLLVGLTLCGCLVFYTLAPSRLSVPRNRYIQTTKGALDALKCAADSGDDSCNTRIDGAAEFHGNEAKLGRPEHLEYPAGFKQFDTSNPNSPYNQETYDLSESDEDSSILDDEEATYFSRLSAWTPYTPKYNGESHNPVIWQTYMEEPNAQSVPYTSWTSKNKPKWSRTFLPNSGLSTAMDRLSRDLSFLNDTFHALPAQVLRLDFLRYVTLFKDGGVYADIDTNCYVSIDTWYSACYSDASSHGERVRASQPGLIVGVEFDLLGDPRITEIDGRRVALANYVFAANKGHPVLARMISHIVTRTLEAPSKDRTPFDVANTTAVHEWTGRKIWTDTIIAHIQSTVQGFREKDLLGLTKAKVFGDICVLPIQAFGSGQMKFRNSPDSESEGVYVSATLT